jgi:hypothetical protein
MAVDLRSIYLEALTPGLLARHRASQRNRRLAVCGVTYRRRRILPIRTHARYGAFYVATRNAVKREGLSVQFDGAAQPH